VFHSIDLIYHFSFIIITIKLKLKSINLENLHWFKVIKIPLFIQIKLLYYFKEFKKINL
jgi:hypothetical protein